MLIEKGILDESAFDSIHASLPAEVPLTGAIPAAAAAARSSTASPAQNANPTAAPTRAFQNLDINNTQAQTPAPPSYNDTPPPGLPARNAKPVIATARALYKYAGSDARDVSFEKDDRISVHEYMNQDWWMGKNDRTGQEGIFPRNYVFVEQENKPADQPRFGYPAAQGPPAQQNPYNANVPPMAVADGGQGGAAGEGGNSKGAEYGKKFGKKLGNAAIFGAGATIGGKIVNGIF